MLLSEVLLSEVLLSEVLSRGGCEVLLSEVLSGERCEVLVSEVLPPEVLPCDGCPLSYPIQWLRSLGCQTCYLIGILGAQAGHCNNSRIAVLRGTILNHVKKINICCCGS